MSVVLLMSVVSFVVCFLILSVFITFSGRFFFDREKSSPFECGFDPKDSARIPFSMRFFLLAVVFLVFDLEIVLLVPVILVVGVLKSVSVLLSSFTFLFMLYLGVVYEWWEGSFDWIN